MTESVGECVCEHKNLLQLCMCWWIFRSVSDMGRNFVCGVGLHGWRGHRRDGLSRWTVPHRIRNSDFRAREILSTGSPLQYSCLGKFLVCTPWSVALPGSSVHGIVPGKNTGVGCHFLFQGIFLTQGSNPHLLCLLHWQAVSLPLVPPGKPR